ncbi:MAG: hypothetical protein ACKOU7_04720 [Ferruginibacter sp.]
MISLIKFFFEAIIFALMFKKITASILLLAFVSQTFAGPFILLDYFVNTAAYAKNCINKARPKMHCNGKCQAMKKLEEQKKKDMQDSQRKAENKLPVLSSKSFFCSVKIISSEIKKRYPLQNVNHTCDMALAVFHPPQA